MRKNLFTWIMGLTLFVGEIHSLWFVTDDVNDKENWILRAYKPMTLSWNLKYLEGQILVPLYFIAFLFYRPTKVNRTTVRTFVYFGVIDTIMYFYDFKNPMFFGSVYAWILAIWFLVYYWKTDKGILVKHLLPKRWTK